MSRKLTEDEKLLWKQETASIRKTKSAAKNPPPDANFNLDMIEEPTRSSPQKKAVPVVKNSEKPIYPTPNPQSPTSLILGNYAGVDAATVRRIKRGQLAVGARIDLHGMTQAEAQPALMAFIQNSAENNKRLVLVITGKGRIGQGGGVLRTMLPGWLNHPEIKSHILAFDTAQIRHGGSGAFYILLRRNRL